MREAVRLFRWVAATELVTLLVLLVNLATVHLPVITSLGGPTHGCAYLFVVVATLRSPSAPARTKVVALLPGIGGLLVARRLAAPS
ncbi:hypothetical protein [Actinophytocola oryzae]|uniref:Uncharacterized protein n=1 Tax=Actinophytocola oryzae TaxID=502181 RepID=A0A4R7VYP9_9PSEU|nr:hypothetical protein [Actinophytocola oryzae]TDV55320.1 hypothetical protein CLV71_103561 [Actinophytocola oryzae]